MAVSKGMEQALKKQWEDVKASMRLDDIGGTDLIKFYAAYYDLSDKRIELNPLE